MPEESKNLLIESQASRETLLKELIRNSLMASDKYFSYQMMCLPRPNAIQAQVSPYRDKLRYWSKAVFFFFFFYKALHRCIFEDVSPKRNSECCIPEASRQLYVLLSSKFIHWGPWWNQGIHIAYAMELFIHSLLRVGGFFFLIFAASSQPLVPQCYEGNSDEDTEMNIHGNCKHRKFQMRNPMIFLIFFFFFF